MADIFQGIDGLDAGKQELVVNRLEGRARMARFAEIRENYFERVGLPAAGRIHELGCGTGPVCRAVAARPGFAGASRARTCRRR